MLLSLVLGLMTALVLVVLLTPLLRPAPPSVPRADYDRSVYRDQLDEITRDRERGVLSEGEAGAARLEIERRLLAATPRSPEAVPPSSRTAALTAAVAIILVVPGLGLGLYLSLGSPDLPDAPLAGRKVDRKLLARDGSMDLDQARAALVASLAKEPDSLEGWQLLARTDTGLRRWQDARTDFDKVLALSNRTAATLEQAAESRVAEADGDITPEAKALFEEALQKQPGLPGARFDLALARAQAGDTPGALEQWRALANDAPADAPWLPSLRATIAEGERSLTLGNAPAPEASPPGPEMAQMMALPADQRQQAIRGMVAGLAAKLEQHPDDLAGWTRLGRSYLVLGEPQNAADAYGKALALKPADEELALGRARALKAVAGPDDALTPDAIAAYATVASIKPDEPEALFYLGLAALQQGRPAETTADWQKVLALLPPDAPEAIEVKRRLALIQAK